MSRPVDVGGGLVTAGFAVGVEAAFAVAAFAVDLEDAGAFAGGWERVLVTATLGAGGSAAGGVVAVGCAGAAGSALPLGAAGWLTLASGRAETTLGAELTAAAPAGAWSLDDSPWADTERPIANTPSPPAASSAAAATPQTRGLFLRRISLG